MPGDEQTRGSPQHTAMVVTVISAGVVDVVEQNNPAVTGPVQTLRVTLIAGPAAVTSDVLAFETAINGTTTKVIRTIKSTTTETVTAPPRCYRPTA